MTITAYQFYIGQALRTLQAQLPKTSVPLTDREAAALGEEAVRIARAIEAAENRAEHSRQAALIKAADEESARVAAAEKANRDWEENAPARAAMRAEAERKLKLDPLRT